MTGNEYLKNRREEKGYSQKAFVELCDISQRYISSLETGERSLCGVPVAKITRLFAVLDIACDDFFEKYYHSHFVCLDKRIVEWNKNNPRIYERNYLKKRYYQRIAQIKGRNTLDITAMDGLVNAYKDCFLNKLDNVRILSDDQYEDYILPLNCKIRSTLSSIPKEPAAQAIVSAIFHTEYSFADVAKICEVTVPHLRGCLDGTYDIMSVNIILALKLCRLLSLDFENTFIGC